MIRIVQAHRELSGASAAWFVTCDDGKDYAVKFYDDLNDNTIINEYVCNKLANLLELPIPRGEIIQVENDMAQIINLKRNKKINEGPHYGSQFINPFND